MSDDLDEMISEFRRKHPLLWYRTQLRSKWRQALGRYLPRLCSHHCSMGPAGGVLACMDCGVLLPEDSA